MIYCVSAFAGRYDLSYKQAYIRVPVITTRCFAKNI